MRKNISELPRSIIILLFSAILIMAGVSISFASSSPPPLPNSFSGTVKFAYSNGLNDAPAGTSIEALINNITRGNTTVLTPGIYSIDVSGFAEDDGKEIVFNVNNMTAEQRVLFNASNPPPRTVNLVVNVLNKTWRFISVPFVLDNSSVNNVLAGIDYDQLFAWNPVNKIFTSPVTTLEPLHGYLIHMNTSQRIPDLVNKSGPYPLPSMGVFKGWNLIGTPGNISLDAETMLGAIDDSYFNIWNWNVSQQAYDQVGINNNLSVSPPKIVKTVAFTMQPVASYWVWVTRNNTLPAFSP